MAALIRPRAEADLPACVEALHASHEASGYPATWPRDPVRWLTSSGAAVDFVRADASRPVLTVADSGDAAIRLYERLGWRRIGQRRADWQQPDSRHPTVYDYVLDPP